MNAIMFQSQLGKAIKGFFIRCYDCETMETNQLQRITVSFTDKGFILRLETNYNVFVQEHEVDGEKIDPMNFQIH